MLNKSVARRYAEALFLIAKQENKIDEYQGELEKFVAIFNDTPNLKEYLSHLLIPAADKKKVVLENFAAGLSPVVVNFIQLLIDKRRESYIEVILEEYVEMAEISRGVRTAELFSAQEVDESVMAALVDKLSKATGKTVRLKVSVDPSLVGGIKLKVGDQVIDGTVAKKLQLLKEDLRKIRIS